MAQGTVRAMTLPPCWTHSPMPSGCFLHDGHLPGAGGGGEWRFQLSGRSGRGRHAGQRDRWTWGAKAPDGGDELQRGAIEVAADARQFDHLLLAGVGGTGRAGHSNRCGWWPNSKQNPRPPASRDPSEQRGSSPAELLGRGLVDDGPLPHDHAPDGGWPTMNPMLTPEPCRRGRSRPLAVAGPVPRHAGLQGGPRAACPRTRASIRMR